MRIIYLKSTKQVVTVVDDENSITAYPSDHCVIQAEPLTAIEMSLALGLEMEALLMFFADKQINFPMTPELEQTLKDRTFGNSLFNEFLAGQKNVILDNNTYRAVSDIFQYAEAALRRGNISQAKTELNNIAEAPPVWTAEAKSYFISKIDNYLGL